PPEVLDELGAARVGHGRVEGGEAVAQRGSGAGGEERGCPGAFPGQQLPGLARARTDERRPAGARGQQAHAMAREAQAEDRPAQQQHVPERARADEEDARGQGTSTRAEATLPSRSMARTTTTCGPGGTRSASVIS